MNSSKAIKDRLRSLDLEEGQLGSFLENLSEDEAARRLDRLTTWLANVNAYNHDGVAITPGHRRLLVRARRLRRAVERARPPPDRRRDTVVAASATACSATWNSGGSSPSTGTFFGRGKSFQELYALFTGLVELGDPERQVFLSDQRLLEARRAGYEAAVFLDFLREFRRNTSRPIMLVPNNKAQLSGGGYGRHWVIEPIEDYLRDGFTVRYNGVTSHATMRLNVPTAFPKEIVKQLCDEMPHIVVVDGGRVPMGADMLRFSRSSRGYANWFAVFNDLRSQGDLSKYEHEGLFHRHNLEELMKWHEYSIVREQMQEWVTPGQTYRMALWGPEPSEQAILGETLVEWPQVEFKGDRPMVVLTNVVVYQSTAPLPGHSFAVPDRRDFRCPWRDRPLLYQRARQRAEGPPQREEPGHSDPLGGHLGQSSALGVRTRTARLRDKARRTKRGAARLRDAARDQNRGREIARTAMSPPALSGAPSRRSGRPSLSTPTLAGGRISTPGARIQNSNEESGIR